MPTFTGLILVSGQDKPGITENLMKTLSEFMITIIDIEQIVIRGRLLLTVLINLDEGHAEAIVEDLNTLQAKLGLDIAVDFAMHKELEQDQDQLKVVIVGTGIKPYALATVAAEIARIGGNIDDIKRTSTSPISAITVANA